MNKKYFTILPLLTFSCLAFSGNCSIHASYHTPRGNIVSDVCRVGNDNIITYKFNGKDLLSGEYPILEPVFASGDLNNSVLLLEDHGVRNPNAPSHCPETLYLIDVRTTPAKVFSFGIKNACNIVEWTSWKGGKGVIAIKHGVRFKYNGNNIIAPDDDSEYYQALSYDPTPTITLSPYVKSLPIK